MLKILKRIVQDVTIAPCLTEALTILVKHVRSAMNVDAVSVYLLDNSMLDYVLVVTDGLNKKAEMKVRVSVSEGLVGLVGRREEPMNIEDFSQHTDYYYNTLLGEEQMHAFLGVPIIQHRKLYGVLTVQETAKRCFDDSEEAFLITLAAQLGGIIAHAEATGELSLLTEPYVHGKSVTESNQISLNGVGSSPGVAVGTAIVIYPPADIDAVPKIIVDDIAAEEDVFYAALQATRENMQKLSKRMKSSIASDEHALFDVYIKILEQESLGAEVANEIRQEKLGAQSALAAVIKRHVQQFERMNDDYLRDRASDFRDIGRRVLAALQSAQHEEIDYPKRTILFGDEITAAALAEVPEGHLAGIVSAKGSTNSHVAILARAMGVPTIMAVRGLKLEQLARRAVIIDGFYGHVFISPSKVLLSEYKKLIQKEDELTQSLISLRDKPAQTTDDHRISLQVNTGLAIDSGMSMSVGAEGVGLYRSEVPFMSRDRFPSEDEQCKIG